SFRAASRRMSPQNAENTRLLIVTRHVFRIRFNLYRFCGIGAGNIQARLSAANRGGESEAARARKYAISQQGHPPAVAMRVSSLACSNQFIWSSASHNTSSGCCQDSMRRFADRNAAERVLDGGQSGTLPSDFFV